MMKRIILFLSLIIIFFHTAGAKQVSADGLGCGSGFGPIAEILCKKSDTETTGIQLNKVMGMIVGLMTAIAAIWFIFQFIIAGYQWIQSGGDKNNLEQARNKITNSLIGLIIVVAAWIIMGIVGKILGIDILNPGKMLLDLGKP